jgi:hypothetical protein
MTRAFRQRLESGRNRLPFDMFLTIWCIAVVCGSILAVGLPVRWLLNSRQPLTPSAWIEVPFYGIAAIILFLQNLVYFDVPLSRSTWILWGVTAALWIWMAGRGHATTSLRAVPVPVFLGAAVVYVIQGLGLLIVGARHYVGRAWNDQFNYTALAQFLTDYPFSTSMGDVGHVPYLALALRIKHDRIGQSVLHGFSTVTSVTDAKVLFEPTILLSPPLITLAVYTLLQRYGLKQHLALSGGIGAGLLPAIALVHLESFLSHALAIPFLLLAPVLIDDTSRVRHWRRLIGTAMLFAATASIYSEILVLVVGVAAAGLLWPRPHSGWILSRSAWLVLLVLLILALNIRFAAGLLTIFGRVDLPILGHVYPWALSVEGLVRVWFGDLGASFTGIAQSILRASALGLTGFGYYGLAQSALLQAAPADSDTTEAPGRAFPWITLGLAGLPIVVLARDDQHPYQFYKLLLTVAPLLVVGVTLALARVQAVALSGSATTQAQVTRRLRTAAAWVFLTAVLAAVGSGTVAMALDSTDPPLTVRSPAHYLLKRDMRELQAKLSALRNERVFISIHDDTWSHGFVNAWLAYFARHNRVWLGNPSLNDVDLQVWPELRDVIDPPGFSRDMLVLTHADMPLPALFSPPATRIWSSGAYELWRPTGDWIYPSRIDNPNGVDGLAPKPRLWLGGGAATIRLFASRDGELQLIADVVSGPGLQGQVHPVRVSEQIGDSTVLHLAEGPNALAIQVRGGLNVIRLEPLGRAVLPLPGADQRPLVVALNELRLTLDDNWVVSRAVNPNGLERAQGKPFFWMGEDPTTIEVLAGRAGLVRFDADVIPGPSIPTDPVRRVRAVTDTGHSQTVVTRGGPLRIVLPVGKGRHDVRLYALDPPRITLPHDPRTLVVGLLGLTVSIEADPPVVPPAADPAGARPRRER